MIAAGVLACVLAQAPAVDTKLQQAFEAYEKELFGAVNARDGATLQRLIAGGFIFIHSTGGTETKEQYIANAVSGRLTSQTASPEFLDRQLRVYGQTAIRTTRTVRARGQPGETNLRTVHVHVNTDAGWRYVSGQSTPLPARPRGISLDPALHDRYIGRYTIDDARGFAVTRDGNVLKGQITGRLQTELIPRSETEFDSFHPEGNAGAVIVFVRDASGAVTHAVLMRDGREVWRAKRDR